MKTLFAFFICLPLVSVGQVLQNVNGTTTVGGQVPASAFPGTPWTNGMTFTATSSNSSVTFVDGANAQVVISNGVIGTVKAITNSGYVKSAHIDVSDATSASGVRTAGTVTQIGDFIGNGNGAYLQVDDSLQTVLAIAAIFTGNGSGLTTLNAGNISSGTLANARLNSNIITNMAGGASFGVGGWSTSTRYFTPFGGSGTTASSTEAIAAQRVTVNTFIRDLDVGWIGVGANTNAVATLFTNGVASNISCNVNGTGSATVPVFASDTTHEVILAAGQNFSIELKGNNPSAAATTVSTTWTFRYHY